MTSRNRTSLGEGPDAPIKVGIAGSGTLAASLAILCARKGCDVLLVSPQHERKIARSAVIADLSRRNLSTRPTEVQSPLGHDRIRVSQSEADFADRQFLFDLHPIPTPDPQPGLTRVSRLERLLADPDATLLIEAGGLPQSHISANTRNPGRVIGVRLLAPVATLPLLEIVTTDQTHPKTALKVGAFATAVLGKHLIESPENSLFLSDATPIPHVVAAIHETITTPIDQACVESGPLPGCTASMTALEFADLIGLDSLKTILDQMHAHDPSPVHEAPQPLLDRIDRGHLGRKTGRGFFHYPLPASSDGADHLAGRATLEV